MNGAYSENLGFLSRMSGLEMRLKQSEDERVALEEKFNKLLSARKSEEELQLFLLRENYSQLLRQDKMRCERNDMILQALANVESRASMLTAKTDRLRLLRRHYESFVNRHYPVLKRTLISRHRSYESLTSDANENTFQRSVSCSPRLVSNAPSLFSHSPAITRRNSLVIPDSEIMYPISYKFPTRIHSTPHSSRRRLFEEMPRQENVLDPKTSGFVYFGADKNDVLNNHVPDLTLSPPEEPKWMSSDVREINTTDLFFDIPSQNDYSIKQKISDREKSKNDKETTNTRMNQSTMSSTSQRSKRISPTRSYVSNFSYKPTFSKPLTKSNSFSVGTGFSRNMLNYSPFQRQQNIAPRRSSFITKTPVPSNYLNRYKTPVSDDFLNNEISSHREKYLPSERSKSPISERSKSPFSERSKSPLRERVVLPSAYKSKSPLTVVDDIFKRYLINYDRRYLSDPISESKYGKYLYPISHYPYSYNEDKKSLNHNVRNEHSYLLEPKYDGRNPHFDDNVSISSRGTISTNLCGRSFGSQESLLNNERRHFYNDSNTSFYDDKECWKEWNHYKNRYEYPPSVDSWRIQTRQPLMDDTFSTSKRENINRETSKYRYKFTDDLQVESSYSLNIYGKSHEFNNPEQDFGNCTRSFKSYERKLPGKQNLTSKETFRVPQTPKKVSFSNEFLYDDKSDTEISSNDDKITVPLQHFKNPEVYLPKTGEINQSQDIIERKTETFDSIKIEENTAIEDSKRDLSLDNLEADEEISPSMNRDELISDSKKSCYSTADGNSSIKDLKSIRKNEEEKVTECYPLKMGDPDYPQEEAKNNDNSSLVDGKEYLLVTETKSGEKSVENSEDFERKDSVQKTEINEKSFVESKTTELLIDSNVDLVTQNEAQSIGEIETQYVQKVSDQDNGALDISSPQVVLDSTSQKYGSIDNLQREKTNEQGVVYDKDPQNLDLGDTPQNYQDPQTNINNNTEISEYPTDYIREQYDQTQHLYDQSDSTKDDVQNAEPGYDETQLYGPQTYGAEDYQQPEMYASEKYNQQPQGSGFRGSQQSIQDYTPQPEMYSNEQYNQQPQGDGFRGSQQSIQDYTPQPEIYSSEQHNQQPQGNSFRGSQQSIQDYTPQPEMYSNEQYNQQPQGNGFRGSQQSIQDYTPQPEIYSSEQYNQQPPGNNFRGSQQSIQDYSQPLLQQEYEQNKEQYKDNDQHYSTENITEDHVAEQLFEGDYPPQHSQQQYDPEYQGPSQVPQNITEQYEADYNTAFQGDSQYGYDQPGGTYEDQKQQPPYDQYEQQPGEPVYDQYDQQPHEPSYNQPLNNPPYDQYKQPTEPPYDQYEQQTTEPPYDQYEQQTTEPPYEQYEQQTTKPPYDQYEQQPPGPPYDQYEQQPTEPPYDQYEQTPTGPPYDQYEQQPEHYNDQYQGDPGQYGNYDYTYDQTAPTAEKPYLGDDPQNLKTQPYEQQSYDDGILRSPYSESVPYEGTETVYQDEQQAYATSGYAPQNLSASQQENIPSDEPLYETETMPYDQADITLRDPTPKLNQILDSNLDSSHTQGPTT